MTRREALAVMLAIAVASCASDSLDHSGGAPMVLVLCDDCERAEHDPNATPVTP